MAGVDNDDPTPADPPGAAIVRTARHGRELCEALERLGPRVDETAADDLPFVLEQFRNIVADVTYGFADLLTMLDEKLALARVFRRRQLP